MWAPEAIAFGFGPYALGFPCARRRALHNCGRVVRVAFAGERVRIFVRSLSLRGYFEDDVGNQLIVSCSAFIPITI